MDKPTLYRVIATGELLEYVRTLDDGTFILMGGRSWKRRPMGYAPDEVEKVEGPPNGGTWRERAESAEYAYLAKEAKDDKLD